MTRIALHLLPALALVAAALWAPERGIIHGPCTTLPAWALWGWVVAGVATWGAYTEIAWAAWRLHRDPVTAWLPRWLLPGVTAFVGSCGVGHLLGSVGLVWWARWDLVALWAVVTAAVSVPVAVLVAAGLEHVGRAAASAGRAVDLSLTRMPWLCVWQVEESGRVPWSLGGLLRELYPSVAPDGVLTERKHLDAWEERTERDEGITQAQAGVPARWASRIKGEDGRVHDLVSYARRVAPGRVEVLTVDATVVASVTRMRVIHGQ